MGDGTLHVGIQWKTILRMSVVGILLIGHVTVWTIVSHLNQECRRLDRFIAAETRVHSDLAQERANICNATDLERFAATHSMVKAPVNGRVVSLHAFSPAATGDTRVAAVIPAAAERQALEAAAQTPAHGAIVAYDFGQ